MIIIYMQGSGRSAIQSINPLIKLVREREELYLELLSFVNKNLESSSNDFDNLTIFNKFLIQMAQKHDIIRLRQAQFGDSFRENSWDGEDSGESSSKEVLRLSSRVIEILEASTARARKSVFDDNGRTGREFARFKVTLHKILKREIFVVGDFVDCIMGFCSNKYQRQLGKIQRYVEKIEQGEDIWLRQLYSKENSDIQHSPDDKKQTKEENKHFKKIDHKIQHEHMSSTEEVTERKSHRKNMKTSIKRKQRPLNIKKKQQIQSIEPPSKQQTANKLLKFYAMMELNKKQFLEDYVYNKIEEEQHKQILMNSLLERNRTINNQINNYVKKSSVCIVHPIKIPSSKSSGEDRSESLVSKVSLKTSFIISKRKSSFHLESSSNQKHADSNRHLNRQSALENTIKNINPRRRSSHSNQRPQEKSRKLFVVKAPMVFEDEMIPQVQITQTQWFHAPFSTKGKQRKNDNLRLKKRNNPNPLQNNFLPQTFRYPL